MTMLSPRVLSRALLALLMAVTGLAVVQAGAPTEADAAACASKNKSLSGTAEGEDGRYLSIQVSIELFTAGGTKIDMNGCAMGGGYSATTLVNEKPGTTCCMILPGEGTPNSTYNDGQQTYNLEKTWSFSGIPSNAATVWIESYTKKRGGQPNTTTVRYGHSMRRPISLSASNVAIRQPLNCGLSGGGVSGSTGSLIGKVYNNGSRVTPTRVSAFSTSPDGGNNGPILSFNVPAGHPSGSYRIDSLSPGIYKIYVSAAGTTKSFQSLRVNACQTTSTDVAVRGSVPRTVGTPVSGDWDGDGDDEPGIWVNGQWILRSDAGPGGTTLPTFNYGMQAGDIPVTGDWDGDGDDEPGIFRRGTWHLRSTAAPAGGTIASIPYGAQPGDMPVPGDWDGDGDDEPGIYRRGGQWHFRTSSDPNAPTPRGPSTAYRPATFRCPVTGTVTTTTNPASTGGAPGTLARPPATTVAPTRRSPTGCWPPTTPSRATGTATPATSPASTGCRTGTSGAASAPSRRSTTTSGPAEQVVGPGRPEGRSLGSSDGPDRIA